MCNIVCLYQYDTSSARQSTKGKKTMKTSTKKIAKVLLFASAILCALLIIMQLVPYWTYNNTETNTTDSISILEYLVLPSAHPDVTAYLNSSSNEAINSLAGTFCFIFLLGAVSIVIVLVKSNSRWISLFPLTVGAGSLIGFLTDPAWNTGSIYVVLVVASALLTLCSLIVAVIWVHSFKYWFMDPKDLPSAKK